MGCTIGWIKSKEGCIIFKNRDTRKNLRGDLVKITRNSIKICHQRGRKGCWIVINKWLGFMSAKGPYRELLENRASYAKFDELGEIILERTNNLERALKLFIESYKKQKIGKSANILLCNTNKAYLLELCSGKINIKSYSRFVFRTNHFLSMRKFNRNFEFLNISVKRLKKFRELFSIYKPKNAEQLIPLLSYHSKDPEENICRHGTISTLGSAIFEISRSGVTLWYSLNDNPCRNKFSKCHVML